MIIDLNKKRKKKNKKRRYYYIYHFEPEEFQKMRRGYEPKLKWVKQKPGFYLDSTGRFKILATGGNVHWKVYDLQKGDIYTVLKFIEAKYLADKIFTFGMV